MNKKCSDRDGISVFKRKDGRYEARVLDTRRFGSDGKRKYKSFYGATKKEAMDKAIAFLYEVKQGAYCDESTVTVAECVNEWFEKRIKMKREPLTVASYTGIIKNHINPNLGGIRVQSLQPGDIEDMAETLSKKKLSPKTVKNVITVLHTALAYAIKKGIIVKNPCENLDIEKCKKHKITPLLDDEIPAFLKAIEADPEFKNAYAFCLFTGIREGECLGLTWDKVDFKGKCITVEQQLQKDRQKSGTYFIKNATKTKKQRTVYLTEDAVACLEDEKKRQEENAKLAGELWDNEWNLVFTNDLGRYIVPMTFYKHFKRIAEKIGRPDLRPHDLRHTLATVAIASGSDVKSLQDMLGHTTAAMTLDVYAHPSDKRQREVVGGIQERFRGLAKGEEKQGQ